MIVIKNYLNYYFIIIIIIKLLFYKKYLIKFQMICI